MSTPWGDIPTPWLEPRFLYLKSESLNDLPASSAKAPGFWRSFSNEENERLLEAWEELNPETRAQALGLRARGVDTTKPINEDVGVKDEKDVTRRDQERDSIEATLSNPDYELEPHQIPVGVDNLWTAELLTLECISSFWTQPHVPIAYATWFLPPTQTGRYQMLDVEVAEKVEEAFKQIGSWHPSYGEELSSAVLLGAEAESKLKVDLNEELDIIFQGPNSARIYSKGVTSRLSKSVLTTILSRGHTHAGGQLALRGWDAVKAYEEVHLKVGNSRESRPSSPVKEPVKSPAKTSAAGRLSNFLRSKPSSATMQDDAADAESVTSDGPIKASDTAKTMESAAPDNADQPLTDLILVSA
jgi:hypothetical protein